MTNTIRNCFMKLNRLDSPRLRTEKEDRTVRVLETKFSTSPRYPVYLDMCFTSSMFCFNVTL